MIAMKKIVILGSNEYTEPLIQKAKSMGLETHVFAWETGAVGEKSADYYYPISVKDKDRIYQKCVEIKPSGVIALGSDLLAVTAAYLTTKLSLPGNDYTTVCRLANKLKFRRILQENNIQQPKFLCVGDEYPKTDCRNVNFPMIVKPTDRGASRGVKKVLSRTSLFESIMQARELSYEGKVIIEEYINGRHFSCECLSVNGQHHILAYTKRDNLENYSSFIEHIHREQARLTMAQKKEIDSIVYKVLDCIGILTGASSVEFFIGPNEEIYVLEVTPVMYGDFIGTNLVYEATGIDYLGMSIRVALGEKVEFTNAPTEKNVRVQIMLSQDDVAELESVIRCEEKRLIAYKYFVEKTSIPRNIDGGRYGYFLVEEG